MRLSCQRYILAWCGDHSARGPAGVGEGFSGFSPVEEEKKSRSRGAIEFPGGSGREGLLVRHLARRSTSTLIFTGGGNGNFFRF